MIFVFREFQQIEEDKIAAEEKKNLINQKILDSILDDNDETFSELISQNIEGDSNPNKRFSMPNYKLPDLLRYKPTYASLCAFFGAEKCFTTLSMLCSEGLTSETFKKKDHYGRSPIHFACAGGCLNIIRELYQAGYDLNCEDTEGYLPSHYSAMFGTTDVLKYLWTKGSDLLKTSRYKMMSPLHLACLYGNIDIVKFLCEKVDFENSKINKNINDYYTKSTPIHMVCEGGHSDILEYFLSTKKELVKKLMKILDHDSRTPLVVACQNGNFTCVKLLLNAGKLNLNPTHRKHAPLIDAAAGGHVDIVEYLLKQKGVDLNATNSQKLTSLEVAILNGHCNVVEVLIKNGAVKNFGGKEIGNLFLMACGTFNIDMIILLDKILEIPYKEMGNMFIKQACKIEDEKLVSFLVEKNCDLNCITVEDFNFNIKWRPFMDFLKEKGVNFSNMKTKSGTPMIVKTIKKGSLNSIREMVDKGVELNRDIIIQFHLIDDACYYGDLSFFNFLMSYEPEITYADQCLKTLLKRYDFFKRTNQNAQKLNGTYQIFEKILNDFKVNPNENGIIDVAINKCLIDFLELLYKYGADFNNLTIDYSQIRDKNPVSIVNFLIQKGVDINTIKTEGGYPIIVEPIEYNDLQFVDFLISNGFELNNDIIEKCDLIEKVCNNGEIDLFEKLLKSEPTIKNPTHCLISTLGVHCASIKDHSELNTRLRIAEILLSEYKANPNEDVTIECAASYCFIEVLELLAKYGADFNECHLDYSKMISSDHILIFEFLKSHGCQFQKQKTIESIKNYNRNMYSFNFNENDTPIMVNFKKITSNSYDVDTLLFLIDFASDDELLNLKTNRYAASNRGTAVYFGDGDKNIIDVLLLFNCFDGILKVYKKLNTVVLPLLKTEEDFKQIIQSCHCKELIDMLSS